MVLKANTPYKTLRVFDNHKSAVNYSIEMLKTLKAVPLTLLIEQDGETEFFVHVQTG